MNMNGQQCGNCYFWEEARGLCLRHAPSPVQTRYWYSLMEMISAIARDKWPDDQKKDWEKTMESAWWPETDEDEWCGEWKSK